MLSVLIAEPAGRDLEAIVDYIARENPAAAENVYRQIARTAAKLPEFPALGRPGRFSGTREMNVVVFEEVGQAFLPPSESTAPETE